MLPFINRKSNHDEKGLVKNWLRKGTIKKENLRQKQKCIHYQESGAKLSQINFEAVFSLIGNGTSTIIHK